MDGIVAAHNLLEQQANLGKTLEDVSTLIEQLQKTRDAVAETPELTAMHMAKLKNPVKQSFDRIEDDLKEVNKGLSQYQKALTNKWKNAQLPTTVNDSLAAQPELIDRAVAMHLLREGMFGVANTFVQEVNERENLADARGRDARAPTDPAKSSSGMYVMSEATASMRYWARDFANYRDGVSGEVASKSRLRDKVQRGYLQESFAQMYHILGSLQNEHDLGPAIDWSQEYSGHLERRGSDLEFRLAQLKFVELYTGNDKDNDDAMTEDGPGSGLIRALEYARETFPGFTRRYGREAASLSGSLAFAANLEQSPYKSLFDTSTVWDDIATAFTWEFCASLGLSPSSPLRTAVTAGGIALPTLSKVERIMTQSRGQWTSVNELPVETPLPPGYMFHSVFVCPVSKEQATDANPPMMLPCGHVIAKESLEMHSRGKSRMKCPYCPNECAPREAKRVYI